MKARMIVLIGFLLMNPALGASVARFSYSRNKSKKSAKSQSQVSFRWQNHKRNYLNQFTEPGTALTGKALSVAGKHYAFTIAKDGRSIAFSRSPGGRATKRIWSGQTVDLRLPLSLATAIVRSPQGKGSAPLFRRSRLGRHQKYTLFVEKDLVGVWRVYPITVARTDTRTQSFHFTISIVDLNLNGIYGEPWEDGIVVDPNLPPWKMTGRSIPPYLKKRKWSQVYGFPDTGPVRYQESDPPWQWHYVVPFQTRFPVEQQVLQLAPGTRPGTTALTTELLAPDWDPERRALLASINRMRLSVGLPSAYPSQRKDIEALAVKHLKYTVTHNKPGWKALNSRTRGPGGPDPFAKYRLLITNGWAGGENSMDVNMVYLPEMTQQKRIVVLHPKTREFVIAKVDTPYPAYAVNGIDPGLLDPNSRWKQWPVIWPPPECDRFA